MITDDELHRLAATYCENTFGVASSDAINHHDTFIAGFRAAEKMMQDRFPNEQECREARIEWATKAYEYQSVKSETNKAQIPTLGIVPWDTCYNWLKSKILGETK
jgi:hypothetical protein